MKIRHTDGALEFTIAAGYFGTFSTNTGLLEVPDDLPAWALVPGLHEIVPDAPPEAAIRGRRAAKASIDEPPAVLEDDPRDEEGR